MTTNGPAIPPELMVNVSNPALYRCFGEHGQLLYIGSGDLGKRLAEHAKKAWFLQVRGITVEWYADDLDARNAERRAIHVEHPKYNVQHRNSSPQGISPRLPRVLPGPLRGVWPEGERLAELVEKAREAEAEAKRPFTTRELREVLGVSNTLTCKVWRILRGKDTGTTEAVAQ